MHFFVNKVGRKYVLELTRWGNNWILSIDIWLDLFKIKTYFCLVVETMKYLQSDIFRSEITRFYSLEVHFYLISYFYIISYIYNSLL